MLSGTRKVRDRLGIERALRVEQADDFAGEQRVALGQYEQAADEVGRHRAADEVGDIASEVVTFERRDDELAAVPHELRERGFEVAGSGGLRLAVRRDHQHRDVTQRRSEKRKQSYRRSIRPVEIVDHEHTWPIRRRGPQRIADVREQPEARELPIGVARSRGQRRGSERGEKLRPGPEWRRAGFCPARRPVRVGPGRSREAHRFLREARLVDARITCDENEAAVAVRERVLVVTKLGDLAFSPDEHATSVEARRAPRQGCRQLTAHPCRSHRARTPRAAATRTTELLLDGDDAFTSDGVGDGDASDLGK
jgi:hypothetical protein